MGGVAASGGYYIASAGDKIYSDKGTITGSIGVVSIIPDLSKLAEKIGIDFDEISIMRLLELLKFLFIFQWAE